MRFVRALYELDDLDDEYPFDDDDRNDDVDDEDEAGDKILHLVSSPGPVTMGRLSIPPEIPLDLLTVNPLQDASVKDAVLRCLQAYLDMNLVNCLVTQEHLDVLGRLCTWHYTEHHCPLSEYMFREWHKFQNQVQEGL